MKSRICVVVLVLLAYSAIIHAAEPDISGEWKGVWTDGKASLRLVFHFVGSFDGFYAGRLDNLDQDWSVPVEIIKVSGGDVRFEMKAASATFHGTLNKDQNRISGEWIQGRSLPLELTRTRIGKASKPPKFTTLSKQQVQAMGPLLHVSPSIHPTPFMGADNKMHLVYELNIANGTDTELPLARLEILDDSQTLTRIEDDGLNRVLAPEDPEVRDYRMLGPRKHAVAYLSIALSGVTPLPAKLRHRIMIGGYSMEGGDVEVSQSQPVVIGPPLRGSGWRVCCGGDNESHRHSSENTDGNTVYGQRFAIDWLKVGENGKAFEGDPVLNKSYHAYGSEVLAVADGMVVEIRDGMPENTPHKVRYPWWSKLIGPNILIYLLNPFDYAGNHIVVDIGDGRFAQYAHLQRGSLRVKVGDRVRRGQLIGLVGNTGNSQQPHLHFQIADRISFGRSEGLPYVIDSFGLLNGGAWEERRSQLPLSGNHVRFP